MSSQNNPHASEVHSNVVCSLDIKAEMHLKIEVKSMKKVNQT